MVLLAEPTLLRQRSVPHAFTAPPEEVDQRVILHGMTWKDFEIMLALRGDRGGVRMAYLNGAIELMSPSINHEGVKKTIARIVEAYGDEQGLDLNGYGSWTLKNELLERGAEPDECYVLGVTHKDVPELAIEVVWTRGGLNKLEIYRALQVGEVWIWERDAGISVYLLRDGSYEEAEKSALLPDLDLKLVERFATSPNQAAGVREFRAALRSARFAHSLSMGPQAAPNPRAPRGSLRARASAPLLSMGPQAAPYPRAPSSDGARGPAAAAPARPRKATKKAQPTGSKAAPAPAPRRRKGTG